MWEGKDGPQPDLLSDLSQTWKEQHPDWTYIFWNGEKIDAFMAGHADIGMYIILIRMQFSVGICSLFDSI